MITVSVVYHSGKGHTAEVAKAVARGAESVADTRVYLISVNEVDQHWEDLDASDATIFGCPTYMGSASAPFKAFMDATIGRWFEQKWKDKIAAGFTNSASQSGDKLNTLIQLAVFAAQLSMIWVGVGDPPGNNVSKGSINDINRLGTFLGMMSQSNGDQEPDVAPPESDRKTAEHFGKRVAEVTQRWNGVGAYTTERLVGR